MREEEVGNEGIIPDSVIERIRQSADIVDIASGYLSLKKAGQNFKGLCPFHDEKTPSFTVSPNKQIFHCFGCGEGGNVFHFLMKIESLHFPEAVRVLGKKMGISVPVTSKSFENKEEMEAIEKARSIHEDARQYFCRVLISDHPMAEKARNYLKNRGIQEKLLGDFSIGFALPQWGDLMVFLERKGWKKPDLEKSGLILKGNQGFFDRFRNRIIFPIHDGQSRLIGFGGRVLDDSTPKYLNSPETILFQKGKHLFGFDKAKIRTGNSPIVVVEGYFDVISAHQVGINNVVGTMGTALTAHHLQLIGRFTKDVVLIFDSDQAGRRAAIRVADQFLGDHFNIKVVSLPAGEDPDSFIRKGGKEAFERLIGRAGPLLDFIIDDVLTEKPPTGIQEMVKTAQQIFPYIIKLTSHLEQGFYLRQLANKIGVPERDLLLEFQTFHRKKMPRTTADEKIDPRNYPKDEEILCHLLVHGKVDRDRVNGLLEGFTHPAFQRLVKAILAALETQEDLDVNRIMRLCSGGEQEVQYLSGLMIRDLDYDDVVKTAEDCIVSVKKKWITRKLKDTEKAIESAEKEGNMDAVRNLQRNFLQLRKQSSNPETVYS